MKDLQSLIDRIKARRRQGVTRGQIEGEMREAGFTVDDIITAWDFTSSSITSRPSTGTSSWTSDSTYSSESPSYSSSSSDSGGSSTSSSSFD